MSDKPADGVRTAGPRCICSPPDVVAEYDPDHTGDCWRAAYSQALSDVAEKVEGLTTWPRVSWFAYDAQVRGVPVNPTEDRVVLDRAEVLAAIEALRSRRPPADAGEGTA